MLVLFYIFVLKINNYGKIQISLPISKKSGYFWRQMDSADIERSFDIRQNHI